MSKGRKLESNLPKTSGIYGIVNKVNGKMYVGQAINIRDRVLYKHRRSLRKNKHINNYLQNAWNKHGESNFEFVVLEHCEDANSAQLTERELAFYIEKKAGAGVYNLRIPGECGAYGHEVSQEARDKIGVANSVKGRRVWTEEEKAALSEERKGDGSYWYGKTFSDEHKEKLSQAQKALYADGSRKPVTESHLSQESIRRLSELNSGPNHPQYGTKHSAERKAKKAASQRATLDRKKAEKLLQMAQVQEVSNLESSNAS